MMFAKYFLSTMAILIGISAQAADPGNAAIENLTEPELKALINKTLRESILLKCERYYKFDLFLDDLLNGGKVENKPNGTDKNEVLNFIRTHQLNRREETAQEAIPPEVADQCHTIAQAVTDAGVLQSALILSLIDKLNKSLGPQNKKPGPKN